MPLILTSSNDMDSSVMISSVREFHNPNRRGATMRMNTEGLNFVSYIYSYTSYRHASVEICNIYSMYVLWIYAGSYVCYDR